MKLIKIIAVIFVIVCAFCVDDVVNYFMYHNKKVTCVRNGNDFVTKSYSDILMITDNGDIIMKDKNLTSCSFN